MLFNSRLQLDTKNNNCLKLFAVFLTFAFSLLFFASETSASSTPIDLTTGSNIYKFTPYGFCANNKTWEYGSLKYTGSSLSLHNYIERTYTTNNYNQFKIVSSPCSTAWGIHSLLLQMPDAWGWEHDGKWLNIDLVSNNNSLPIFNGSVVYGYESGTGAMIPGFIDKRTYDVQIAYDSSHDLSARDLVGTEYSMQYDEIEIYQGQPSYLYHIQFSIPYHSSDWTSNGVDDLEIGTSQWISDVGNNGSHYQLFGNVQSPLFYRDSSAINNGTMFWLYVSVSDEAEFSSEDTWEDQWSADYQATQDWINEQSSNAQNSADSLNVAFSVPWILQPWFNLFVSSDCVNIPTIASMLHTNNTQVCTPWNSTVRGIVTPIFGSITGLFVFGFFIRWLRHGSKKEVMT